MASTGWLITVVPPDSLYYALNPESSTSSEQENAAQYDDVTARSNDGASADPLEKILSGARLNKWRKGKILPLVPDLKGMMRVIGREWNLPSEVGMELFLASGSTRPDGTRDAGTDGEDEGMDGMLNDETWRMIWGECVAEAEAARMRGIGIAHEEQSSDARSNSAHRAGQRDAENKHPELLDSQQIQSPVEMSPTMTEPPLTGNTFGMASEHSSGSLNDLLAGQSVDDLPQRNQQSSSGQRQDSILQPNQAVSSHAGTLTPASSQTSFGLVGASTHHELPVPAAQALLSPSPSSVFPGASSSQHASPFSSRSPRSGGAMQKRVLGRIEFDFDSSTGGRGQWYAQWLKRKVQTQQGWTQPSSTPPHGMKPLQLGTRKSESIASDNDDDVERVHEEAQMEYAPLMDDEDSDNQNDEVGASPRSVSSSLRNEDEETEPVDAEVDRLVSNALATTFPDGPDDFVSAFTVGRSLGTVDPEARAQYTWKDIGSQRILDDRVAIEQLGTPPTTGDKGVDDVAEVRRMLNADTDAASTELLVPARNQLLASPIDLASPNVDREMQPPPILVAHPDVPLAEPATNEEATIHGLGMGIQMEDGEKRGSALVISSQLDMLEKGKQTFDTERGNVLILTHSSNARAVPSGYQVLCLSWSSSAVYEP